jgi:hypothetical protein
MSSLITYDDRLLMYFSRSRAIKSSITTLISLVPRQTESTSPTAQAISGAQSTTTSTTATISGRHPNQISPGIIVVIVLAILTVILVCGYFLRRETKTIAEVQEEVKVSYPMTEFTAVQGESPMQDDDKIASSSKPLSDLSYST